MKSSAKIKGISGGSIPPLVTCIWYLDGDGFDCAVYVDNCEVLSEEQEKKELL